MYVLSGDHVLSSRQQPWQTAPLAVTADNKIKKKDGDMSIPLVRTKDILKALGENKRPEQDLVWIFHGDGKCAGEFPEEAGEQAL